jgi:hypothetical protein
LIKQEFFGKIIAFGGGINAWVASASSTAFLKTFRALIFNHKKEYQIGWSCLRD